MLHQWIKICGVTNETDAEHVVQAGADAIGLNLWSQSKRCISLPMVQQLCDSHRDKIQIVTVSVNAPLDELLSIKGSLQPHWMQLHGDEPNAYIEALQPIAYRAARIRNEDDREMALTLAGSFILLDAYDVEARGGTGKKLPYALARSIAQERPVILAGGLNPDNIYEAIIQVAPMGVDVASGVEEKPGKKDPMKIRDFIQAAREAFKKIEAPSSMQKDIAHV